jgi:molybdopterin-containing oxidoreductase family iron-sulfur binding subunit
MAAENFEQAWRKALHDGLIAGSAAAPSTATLRADFASAVSEARRLSPAGSGGGLEIVFRPDPSVWDGRNANNGWLQELPRPITRLTWDNAALISPITAQRLGLANEDVVTLTLAGRTLDAPVWIAPGHADESVTVHLGFGREFSGRVGKGVGFNAYALRGSSDPWFAQGLEVVRTNRKGELACVQDHHSMEGRELVRVGDIEEYRANPEFAHEGHHEPGPELSLFPPHEYKGYAWGMAIDLNSCTGCNACMIGCQRHFSDTLLRVGNDILQKICVVGQHALHCRAFENIRAVFQ